MLAPNDTITMDLNQESQEKPWSIVNDGVMGGLSRGQIDYKAESLRFHGRLSLENNGGFSWMKSPILNLNLNGYTNVRLRIKGDGRPYDFTLEDSAYSRLYFKQTFETKAGEWTTVELPLVDFQQKYFGRLTGRSFEPDTTIQQIGFLLNDKQPGAFEVEIDFIEFF
jgi:monofunctional biosynthetic peptidoglycan transglycosylase